MFLLGLSLVFFANLDPLRFRYNRFSVKIKIYIFLKFELLLYK
jgi:hypothetical protein